MVWRDLDSSHSKTDWHLSDLDSDRNDVDLVYAHLKKDRFDPDSIVCGSTSDRFDRVCTRRLTKTILVYPKARTGAASSFTVNPFKIHLTLVCPKGLRPRTATNGRNRFAVVESLLSSQGSRSGNPGL